MNKSELIELISTKTELDKIQSHNALNAFLEIITLALRDDEDVNLTGFGSFKASHRAPRKGKNPRTGEIIDIAATKIPTFKAGKSLKEAIK